MKTFQQTNQTNISSSLVIKYIIMGVVITLIVFMAALIVVEAFHMVADSMKRITSYSFAIITGSFMLFGVSRLLDPDRKEKEREELFSSIREAMKEHKQLQ
jgi:hypothetical protein